jgi:hypothetical protein
LEDTIRQIQEGCRLEAEGKSTIGVGVSQLGSSGAVSALSPATTTAAEEIVGKEHEAEIADLEEDEVKNVQTLEEHILSNLLPVKVRLKKQLAAQQGATRNPAGMPAQRRGMLQPPADLDQGKGTFAMAAEQRRKAAEAARASAEDLSLSAPSQFGKPIVGGGSSLTKNLHGKTLGSKSRPHGHGVGSASLPVTKDASGEATETDGKRKIQYAGMVPGSNQIRSGLSAAAGAHKVIIETPTFLKAQVSAPKAGVAPSIAQRSQASAATFTTLAGAKSKVSAPAAKPTLPEDEQKRIHKLRKKKKKRRNALQRENERQRQIYIRQQAAKASQAPRPAGKKGGKAALMKQQGKKKGPRSVEYICALCNETYTSTNDYNPWWALVSHDCPKCRKSQVS